MSSFDIITDSTCDLTPEQALQYDIQILPLGVNVGSSSFMHYADCRELSMKDFYAALRAGMAVSTSATAPAFWLDAMEASLRQGRDVIVLPLSSTLTSGYSNACIAASTLREDYPERKIFVIDSPCASMGLGILLKKASAWRSKGMSAEETAAHAEAAKTHIVHLFTVDSLDHLRRGGRISAATAIIGSVLSVKPILSLGRGGKISVISKARGRKNAIKELVELLVKQSSGEFDRDLSIAHADCPEDAHRLAEAVRSACGDVSISMNCAAPVLGAHVGPGGLGLFFIGKHP